MFPWKDDSENYIRGDTMLDGDLITEYGNVHIKGGQIEGKDPYGSLIVDRDATINGNTTVEKKLTVKDDSTFEKKLTVKDDSTFEKKICIGTTCLTETDIKKLKPKDLLAVGQVMEIMVCVH